MRPTWCDIDLEAISHNVELLRGVVDPAEVCAVVKADGYGHGAVPVARAATDAGATWLAVATVEEGRVLRESGIVAPVLLLSEPAPPEMIEVVDLQLRPTVYSGSGLAAAAAAAAQRDARLPVHLKVDTGMHRVGAAPDHIPMLAQAISDKPLLDFEGLWTHCAVADEPGNPYTDRQLDCFDAVVVGLEASGYEIPIRHAANSAVALSHPRGRYDMVRCGIAVYGVPPADALEPLASLRPAMSVRSHVSMVKTVARGERVSYGLRWEAADATVVATVPIGYADGIRRRLSQVGGEVLIHGRRYPMAGTVTMDQLLVDCGPDAMIKEGDEVVLIGCQGDDEITANEIAAKLDTIGYEVVCDIESRVPRRYR